MENVALIAVEPKTKPLNAHDWTLVDEMHVLCYRLEEFYYLMTWGKRRYKRMLMS